MIRLLQSPAAHKLADDQVFEVSNRLHAFELLDVVNVRQFKLQLVINLVDE
jgi:hypothetical protein